jgi:hypothetical protein
VPGAFVGDPLPPPPHPATIAASSNVVDHIIGLVTHSNLFILLLLIYLIPKSIGAIDRPLAGTYPGVLREIFADDMFCDYASLGLVYSNSKPDQPETKQVVTPIALFHFRPRCSVR